MDLASLISFAVENEASDIHLQAGSVPMVRVGGQMRVLDLPVLGDDEMRRVIASIVPSVFASGMEDLIIKGIDFSHAIDGGARFRCNAYSHLGRPGLVMRVIQSEIGTIAGLNLPEVLEDIALSQRGLILVSGTTGSGKSTTIAAMIALVGRTYRTKIISIEDPVEYVFQSNKSLISQLEVGRDTPSFEHGFRQALRQDPDAILVGELRDLETMRIALRAADTGHQVFSTVHSADAAQTVERLVAMIPPSERALLLSQLARSLEAIVAQRLVTTRDQKLLPAVEILRGTAVAEKLILENKLADLSDYIAGGEIGMQTFDQHLLQMYNAGNVSGTQALRWSSNPEAMSMALRGIRTIGSGRPDEA